MRGLLMRAAAAADSHHLTLAHAAARLASLQSQLWALHKARAVASEMAAAAKAPPTSAPASGAAVRILHASLALGLKRKALIAIKHSFSVNRAPCWACSSGSSPVFQQCLLGPRA